MDALYLYQFFSRPYRDEWKARYDCYSDPVSSVWIDRERFMDQRQAMLDASQNVFTRVM